ncbi:hypothetical protein RJT34_32017 [Clitoria ternatea]|uniref:Uncharacterized protein n=1 Tax=Clitoria ternatea TaxID=43366 RepID=A0AAN9F346_CLITE
MKTISPLPNFGLEETTVKYRTGRCELATGCHPHPASSIVYLHCIELFSLLFSLFLSTTSHPSSSLKQIDNVKS